MEVEEMNEEKISDNQFKQLMYLQDASYVTIKVKSIKRLMVRVDHDENQKVYSYLSLTFSQ